MKPFFIAVAYSWRAGVTHKSFAQCRHRHRTRGAAYDCAAKQPKRVDGKSRRWTAEEIVFVRTVSR